MQHTDMKYIYIYIYKYKCMCKVLGYCDYMTAGVGILCQVWHICLSVNRFHKCDSVMSSQCYSLVNNY